MAVVWIPSLLRNLTAGQKQARVPGKTVGEAIDALDGLYPGIKARLCEGDHLNPALMAMVNGVEAGRGLTTPVSEETEIHFLPAIGGG
jgi:molybdopterin synthase sulfur carrier subunit